LWPLTSMSAKAADDAGAPNPPGAFDPSDIVWKKTIQKKWWRNTHGKARSPLAFSNAAGRFSHPTLPFKTLYLGTDPITCFWESGLGRNLINRFSTDRTITEDDLVSRIEYTVSVNATRLRLYDANESAARRSIGTRSTACFQADHRVSRQWAMALFSAGAHGIFYASARSDGTCLALFESAVTRRALVAPRRVRHCYGDAPLLASLFRESIRLLGGPAEGAKFLLANPKGRH
jgi:hypothetical protein